MSRPEVNDALLNQPLPDGNRCRRSHNMSLKVYELVITEYNKVGTFDLNLVILDFGDCSSDDFEFVRLEMDQSTRHGNGSG